MGKLLPIMGLILFLAISCEDEVVASNCVIKLAAMTDNPFVTQLQEWSAAIGDSTYVQPSDWKTNCDAYAASFQEYFDEGCAAPEDSVTQADIDAISLICDF